jgi:hypothetical protein
MKQCTDDHSHVLLPLKTFDHQGLTDIANIDVLIKPAVRSDCLCLYFDGFAVYAHKKKEGS